MGKNRRKNGSELEFLRGQNRSLRSENKALKKRLKQLERREHFFEEIVDYVAVDEVPQVETCPSCKKGTLTFLDLTHLKILKCDQCDYKEKLKPNGQKTTK